MAEAGLGDTTGVVTVGAQEFAHSGVRFDAISPITTMPMAEQAPSCAIQFDIAEPPFGSGALGSAASFMACPLPVDSGVGGAALAVFGAHAVRQQDRSQKPAFEIESLMWTDDALADVFGELSSSQGFTPTVERR